MKQIRLILVLIIICLAPSKLCAYDFEQDGFYYNLLTGTTTVEVTSGDNKYTGDVKIPESVEYQNNTYTVVSIGWHAFMSCRDLTSVSIPNTIESIGQEAFYDCPNMTIVTFEGGSVYIRVSAFNATNIKYIISKMTTPKECPSGAFYNSSYSLGPVVCVPKGTKELYYNTQGWSLFKYVVEADRPEDAFLEDLKLYRVYGKDITLVQGTSEGHDLSETITHDGVDYTLTAIGEKAYVKRQNNDYHYFSDYLVIPSTINSIGAQAFATCQFGEGILSKITSPFVINSNTFSDETKANVKLYVPAGTKAKYQATEGWKDFANIVDPAESAALQIGDTFSADMDGTLGIFIVTGENSVNLNKCGNVSNVVIPSKVTYNGVEYTITGILGTATNNVYRPNEVVFGSNVTTVEIPNTVNSIGACAFWKCENLTSVTIPSSVTEIGDDAFLDCSKLSSITLPSNLQTIGEWAFSNCSLSAVTIPTSVTSIGYGAFQIDGIKVNTSDLTSFAKITPIMDRDTHDYGSFYPNWNLYVNNNEVAELTIPESITSLGAIFAYCKSLTSITIHKNVTEISASAFSGCTNINKVVAYSKTPVNISGSIRFEDTVLKNATLYVPSGTTAAYKNAGWNFTNIEELEGLQDGDVFTAMANGGTLRFKVLSAADKTCQVGADSRSDGLDTGGGKWNGVIPSKVTGSDDQEYTVIGIGNRAFYEYDGFESFTLPATLKQISEGAFMRCHDLKYITIPAGVTTMGNYIFNGQEKLTEVVSLIENPYSIDESTFAGKYGNKATLVVPAGKKAAYQNTDGWKLFTRIVEMKSGDADGNENVDEQDVNMVKDYIMTGKEPEGFVRQNADTQSTNKITVVDIVNILNIIKSKK